MTDKLKHNYNLFGAYFPLMVLNKNEVIKYNSFCVNLINSLGGSPEPIELTQMHLVFKDAMSICENTNVLEIVKQIIGNDILVWATSIFYKKPNSSSFVGWHQDNTYWELSDSNLITTAWIALTPSTLNNGAMQIIPCSHKSSTLTHVKTNNIDNVLSRKQNIEGYEFNKYSIPVILNPGEMSLHHSSTVHSSPPNLSNELRIGFVIRYISTNVKQSNATPKTILVNGKDDFRYFKNTIPKRLDINDESIAIHKNECAIFLNDLRGNKN